MSTKPKKKARAREIELEVVGLQYRLTPPLRRKLGAYAPFPVFIERDRNNLHDKNAIKVSVDPHAEITRAGMHIGYLRKEVAAEWAAPLDSGKLVIDKATLVELYPEEGTALIKVELRKLA